MFQALNDSIDNDEEDQAIKKRRNFQMKALKQSRKLEGDAREKL